MEMQALNGQDTGERLSSDQRHSHISFEHATDMKSEHPMAIAGRPRNLSQAGHVKFFATGGSKTSVFRSNEIAHVLRSRGFSMSQSQATGEVTYRLVCLLSFRHAEVRIPARLRELSILHSNGLMTHPSLEIGCQVPLQLLMVGMVSGALPEILRQGFWKLGSTLALPHN